jgi:hypothetical protein
MFDATRAGSSDSARQALRIFISSTAIDLKGFREHVRDALLGLNNQPIAMETFSALGGEPASECKRLAAGADAVICIVAHRYGYVPPVELGGDGERSMTWLEVEAAKEAGKPVFAFLVDPEAAWTGVKEQDRLVKEPEKADEIVKAVRKLQEFKDYLGRKCTLATFASPEQLGQRVVIALANFTPQATTTVRVWTPLFCHALQPAQHFRGRVAKLQDLKDWLQSPVTPDRVVSVVAAGGTGKTALVDKALHEATLSDRAGVFVWSFYEDPRTDAFLRAAYTYFTGERDAPAGGMLERLQLALSGDLPHVLVLDGLERVQSDGDRGRRGELEDLQLKRLVRALAGGVGNARALVTSRFPLVDLEGWTGAGHRAIVLDDLELLVAVDVLRAWGVTGDDAALARVIEPLNIAGFYHALSVAVLGSYLGNFGGREFSLADAEESGDHKARKLHRILEQYAQALTPAERDLLARLSLFPRGVKVELLGWIVQSGGEVAGALVGLADRQLVSLLEGLRKLGLVFRYETGEQIAYSAHPFLRDFFRNLLGTKPEPVHESVRSKLAPSLDARPAKPPSDPAILDKYELLIEQTLLSGRVQEAFDLYWFGLGDQNLIFTVGDNARGLRVLERFAPKDDFSLIAPHLRRRDQSVLVNNLGFLAKILGDLARARIAFAYSQVLGAPKSGFIEAQNLADTELLAGRFREAAEDSENALELAAKADETGTAISIAYWAASRFALGDISAAVSAFQRATALECKPPRRPGSRVQAHPRRPDGRAQPDRGQPRDLFPARLERRPLPVQRPYRPACPIRRSSESCPAPARCPSLRQPLWQRRTATPLLPRRLRTPAPPRRLPSIHRGRRSRHPAGGHLRVREVLHRHSFVPCRNVSRRRRCAPILAKCPQRARPLRRAGLPVCLGKGGWTALLRHGSFAARRAGVGAAAAQCGAGVARAVGAWAG